MRKKLHVDWTFLKKNGLKVIIIVVVLGLIFSSLVYFKVINFNSKTTFSAQQRLATATYGNLKVTISGSGSLSISSKTDVTATLTSKVAKVYLKEGDSAKKGDKLFDLEDKQAKLAVSKLKTQISQESLTSKSNTKNLTNLNIKAPFAGQVTNVTPKVGDVLGKNSNILTITDLTKLKTVVQFNEGVFGQLSVGMNALVKIQQPAQSVEGTISYIGNGAYAATDGTRVFDVEISIANPGTLKDAVKGIVEITTTSGVQTSVNAGNIEYVNKQVLKSEAGGTVKSVNVKENQFVVADDLLVELKNDELVLSQQSENVKIQELRNQLDTANQQLTNCKIVAPTDGKITAISVAEKDDVAPAKVLASMVDETHMDLEISIDELDISKVSVGQKANITVDALTETTKTPIAGEIYEIAKDATPSNGVSAYPVKIKVEKTAALISGMNAHAEIVINEKTNILLVPLEAIQKMRNQSFVMLKVAGNSTTGNTAGNNAGNNPGNNPGNSNGNNPGNNAGNANSRMQGNSANTQYNANSVRTVVEIGINNDTYIEIISGLKDGDQVVLPQLTTSTTQTNTQNGNGNGMGGASGLGGMGGMGGNTGVGGNRNGGMGGTTGGNTRNSGNQNGGTVPSTRTN